MEEQNSARLYIQWQFFKVCNLLCKMYFATIVPVSQGLNKCNLSELKA